MIDLKELMRKNYVYIGVRSLSEDEKYQIGDTCRESYDWDFEYDISTYDTDNPVTLGGTCAIDTYIDIFMDEEDEAKEKLEIAIEKAKGYFYGKGRLAIIAGLDARYGNDEDEIIINDAEVLAIVE